MKPIRSEGDVDELLDAARTAAVIAAWKERGLLRALADGPVALSTLDADPRAVATTAPILAHAGLIMGDGERFVLTDVGRDLLDRDRLLGWRDLRHLRELGRMGDVMADGGPVLDDAGRSRVSTGGVRPEDPEASASFLQMLYDSAADAAPRTFRWTAPRVKPGGHVLDLGGGHGRYARCFADAGFTATLLDMPMVVALARARHGDALRYLEGDFLAGAALGGPYDCALLSNIAHGQSSDENRALIARLHDAMLPGGVLVLKDMFLDDLGRDPAEAVYFGVTMLYYTARGRSYDLREVGAWCAAAGFEPIESAALGRFSLVFARKPLA